MWHEASVVEMRENHNVVVFKELLMAGDVELNPGPYPPGIFISVSESVIALSIYLSHRANTK